MKIVNRQTFLALPANTVFSTYAPCSFGPLMIKGDTLYGDDGAAWDFCEQGIDGAIACTGSEDMMAKLEVAERDGTSLAMDFDSQGREGLYDDTMRYAVWEEADVRALVNRLKQCLPEQPPFFQGTLIPFRGGDVSAPIMIPIGRGCIGTRYCHACKIRYGGTCLCMPNACHECSAQCGTEPPPDGTTYRSVMHYG